MEVQMMRTTTLTLLPLALASPALAETRTFEVDPFTAVEISSGIVGIVTSGAPQAVEAEAGNAAVLNRLHVEVRGGRLSVGIDWNLLDYLFTFGQHPPITVRVSAPSLNSVAASSGANVDARGLAGEFELGSSSGASLDASGVTAAQATAEASSGGGITVTGRCDRLVVEASSGGHVAAGELSCKEVDAEASSGGYAEVSASEEIEADVSSGGHVAVRGNPARTDYESSSGGWIDTLP
jgi:hypothetical protein